MTVADASNEIDDIAPGPSRPPKSDAFVVGYAEAERRFTTSDDTGFPPDYSNPFRPGTEQYAGFEAGVYDFTNK